MSPGRFKGPSFLNWRKISNINPATFYMNPSKKPVELERLYKTFNSRKWVHPDPLEYLYGYAEPADMEIVGFIASSLAYGRVAQILKSVGMVLRKMGPSPSDFIKNAVDSRLHELFAGFRHRFTTGEELSAMLLGIKRVLERYGSLNRCMLEGYRSEHDNIIPALSFFMKELTAFCGNSCNSLMPLPERGSACKRLHLFLRWMIRRDNVDPGGWSGIPASRLVIPLDTHMHRICGSIGFSNRNSADIKTALEITEAFRLVSPDDPVKFDFALTRLGIRSDTDLEGFLDLLKE